jgi:hypothetical protein
MHIVIHICVYTYLYMTPGEIARCLPDTVTGAYRCIYVHMYV